MRLFVLFGFTILASVSLTYADNKSSESAEKLSSKESIKGNNTDASDGKVQIEEQYDGDSNSTFTSEKTPDSSSKIPTQPTSSAGPQVKTTTPKHGKPRAPSFTVWSFFLGIVVAFFIIGLAVFAVKSWRHKRASGNNVPYTSYQ